MPTAPDRLLRRLEWRVVRRLDGRLQGAYRTAYRGSGLDFTTLRPYLEGDEARHIDWNATARVDEPVVREFLEDRDLTTWLVLDRSASMSVGRSTRSKADVLTDLALVLARVLGRGGNRVGAVMYDTGQVRVVPPGTGRDQALVIAAALDRTATPRHGATTDLAAMLETVAWLARRRSLVLVLSDLIGVGEWQRSLTRLVHRHEVAVLRIVDAIDDTLPQAGVIVVEDAETGEQLVVDSGDPLFQVRLRTAVGERDAALDGAVRRAGAATHRISTDRDLVEALVEVVAGTRWRRT